MSYVEHCSCKYCSCSQTVQKENEVCSQCRVPDITTPNVLYEYREYEFVGDGYVILTDKSFAHTSRWYLSRVDVETSNRNKAIIILELLMYAVSHIGWLKGGALKRVKISEILVDRIGDFMYGIDNVYFTDEEHQLMKNYHTRLIDS